MAPTSSPGPDVEVNVVPVYGAVRSNYIRQPNTVTTSKYTWYNFIFLNLYHQLSTLANLYFVFIGILQMIPSISTSNGVPTIFSPLLTILTISGVRAAMEDLGAYRSDRRRNNALFWRVLPLDQQNVSQQIAQETSTYLSSNGGHGGDSGGGMVANETDTPLLTHSPELYDHQGDGKSSQSSSNHPSVKYHRAISSQGKPGRQERQKWESMNSTDKPHATVMLPGLELPPRVAHEAFEACKPKPRGFLAFLGFGTDSSPSQRKYDDYDHLLPTRDEDTPNPSSGLDGSYKDPLTMAATQNSPNSSTMPGEDSDLALDKAIASRRQLLIDNSHLGLVRSGELSVGSIIKLYKDQMVPADMILLGTSETRNHCFIDKANLNGETQLEVVTGIPALKSYFGVSNTTNTTTTTTTITSRDTPTIPSLYDIDLSLTAEPPNGSFESFCGTLHVYQHADPTQQPLTIPLNIKNLLLRETTLRNSEYIYGFVVYTGNETKLRQSLLISNDNTGKVKTSKLSHRVNQLVGILFCFQLSFCILAGIYYALWTASSSDRHWYLLLSPTTRELIFDGVSSTFTWMILISTFVPISLIVTAELCKFLTSLFIEWDLHLYDPTIDKPAKCNTSTVHEDLGLIDFVFSDKTGTLTQNKMDLRYISVAIHSSIQTQQICQSATESKPLVVPSLERQQLLQQQQQQQQQQSSSKRGGFAKSQQQQHQQSIDIDDSPFELNYGLTPLTRTAAFEAFGTLETEISRNVKKKMRDAGSTSQRHIVLSDGTSIPFWRLPHDHPMSYQGLPTRWTDSLLEHNLISPSAPTSSYWRDALQSRRLVNAIALVGKQWTIGEMMINAYRYLDPLYVVDPSQTLPPSALKDAQRGKTQGNGYWPQSLLWNTVRGHGYYEWTQALRINYIVKEWKYYIQHRLSTSPRSIEQFKQILRSSPIQFGRTNGTTNSSSNSLSQSNNNDHELRTFSRESILTEQYDNIQRDNSIMNGNNNNNNNNNNQYLFTSPSFLSGQQIPLHTSGSQPSQMNTNNNNNNNDDDFTPISTFNVSTTLHRIVAEQSKSKPQESTAFSLPHDSHTIDTSSFHPTLSSPIASSPNSNHIFPSYPLIYSRLQWERDYYLSPQMLLGSFGLLQRNVILTALWSKNWATPENNVYVAEDSVRMQLFRYFRHLALSSTVKAYRKPDGSLDWQFESAEELSMTRLAAACGFYRDVHPNGNGAVLYIREYFTPDFDLPDIEQIWASSSDTHKSLASREQHHKQLFARYNSKLHVECWTNIAVFGFNSRRARVTVVWQRRPDLPAGAPFHTVSIDDNSLQCDCHCTMHQHISSPSSQDVSLFDINCSFEGYATTHHFSSYINEYDWQFRSQRELRQSCATQPYFSQQCDSESSLFHQQLRNTIHIMTKGQDTMIVPLLGDQAPIVSQNPDDSTAELPLEREQSLFSSSVLNENNPAMFNVSAAQVLYSNPHHSFQQQLREMSNNGLRCLVVASSEATDDWWAQFESIYSFICNLDGERRLDITSLRELPAFVAQNQHLLNDENPNITNSPGTTTTIHSHTQITTSTSIAVNELKHQLYEFIERTAQLSLLGVFGMEDKLQVLVPETIRDLRRAGIRVWLLSGDKLETCKNIALACDFIDANMLSTPQSQNAGSSASQQQQQHLGLSSNTQQLQASISQPNIHHQIQHIDDELYDANAQNNFSHALSSLSINSQDMPPEFTSPTPLSGTNLGSVTSNLSQVPPPVSRQPSRFTQDPSSLSTIELKPAFLPLCVRLHQPSRLFQITASWWLQTREHGKRVMTDLFTALTEYEEAADVMVDLGYIQQCLMYLGLDLIPSQIGMLFVLDPSDIDTLVRTATAATQISRQRFVDALHLLAQDITMYEAVSTDLHECTLFYDSLYSQYVPNKQRAAMPEIALLVNRTAFHVLFNDSSPRHCLPNPIAERSIDRVLANCGLPRLAQKFFILAALAKSVVFARAEPAMKKRTVTSMHQLFPLMTSLAIGDGANDTEMITAANIGVGLAGIEGTAASNSADYSFTTFRMLHRLLLVHGTWSYHRVNKLILMMFYKGSLLAFTHLFFGFHTSFSGTVLYNDMLYQLYAMIYTAWCVILLGTLNQQLPATVLENSPVTYRESKSQGFSICAFFTWMFKSLFHSAIIFYIPLLPYLVHGTQMVGSIYEGSFELIDNQTNYVGVRGKIPSYFFISSLQLCACSIIPNLMSLSFIDNISLPTFILVGLSILTPFICISIVAAIPSFSISGDLHGTTLDMFSSPDFWMLLFVTIIIPFLFEFTRRYLSIHWTSSPGVIQLLKERIYLRSIEYNTLVKQQFTSSNPPQLPPSLSSSSVTHNTSGDTNYGTSSTSSPLSISESFLSASSSSSSSSSSSALPPSTSAALTSAYSQVTASIQRKKQQQQQQQQQQSSPMPSHSPDIPSIFPADVQIHGTDPNPNGLASAELFGEAGGYGVRATASDEYLVNDPDLNPHDHSLRITLEAERLLSAHCSLDQPFPFMPPAVVSSSSPSSPKQQQQHANHHHHNNDDFTATVPSVALTSSASSFDPRVKWLQETRSLSRCDAVRALRLLLLTLASFSDGQATYHSAANQDFNRRDKFHSSRSKRQHRSAAHQSTTSNDQSTTSNDDTEAQYLDLSVHASALPAKISSQADIPEEQYDSDESENDQSDDGDDSNHQTLVSTGQTIDASNLLSDYF